MPKSLCRVALKEPLRGVTFLLGLKALIVMASALTPHSPNVLPSVAYISVQSNFNPSGLFISLPALMAAAVAAATNSSVTKQVQFRTDVIR